MEPHDRCPEHGQLLALRRGELSEDVAAAVCEHLSSCPACESRLALLWDAEGARSAPSESSSAPRPATRGRTPKDEASPEPQERKEAQTLLDEFPLPTRLGKYRLVRELGRGGMGIVYAAIHANLNKTVAVKVILPEYADSPRAVARFRREAQVVGELSHPNVVTATDADEADGRHFLVMELIDGADLETLARRVGPLRVGDACELVRQAAVGLQYIHEKGRVHRDLKPSNLMLSSGGVVKILDLGLAGLLMSGSAAPGLTGAQDRMGTADYMAPEQWIDSHSVDIRADLYSLGCTLYRLLTGLVPFGGPEYAMLARKQLAHAEAPAPSVLAVRGDVPAELDAIIRKMLGKRPTDRFAEPQEVVEALLPFAVGADCKELIGPADLYGRHRISWPPSPPGETVSHVPGKRSAEAETATYVGGARNRRWLALGVLLLAGVAATGLMYVGHQPTEPHQQDAKEKPAVPPVVPPVVPPNMLVAVEEPKPRPGEWFPLLKQEPTTLFIEDPRHTHKLIFDRGKNEALVDTPYITLHGLDQTEYAGYRVQLGMRQNQWTGGLGLFFGYREERDGDTRRATFQIIELNEYAGNGEKAFKLDRRRVSITWDKGGVQKYDSVAMGSAFCPRPPNREERILEIDVRPQGLFAVTWNGQQLTNVAIPARNAELAERDYVGWFGLFARSSSGTFGNARLMLFERQAR